MLRALDLRALSNLFDSKTAGYVTQTGATYRPT
jgi:hypothetical protein